MTGSVDDRITTREWLSEHKILIWVVALGTLASVWIVPYHRITARAECTRLYAAAHSWKDSSQVDATTVRQWDRFPGLTFRCEVFRRELGKAQ